jgi:hypothetical protein
MSYTPLYPREDEIAVLVLGKRHKEWPHIASYLEHKHGMPCIDEIMGGRFWPAIEAFFRARHGVALDDAPQLAPKSSRVRVVPFRPDGKDNLNGTEAPTAFDRRNSGRDHR